MPVTQPLEKPGTYEQKFNAVRKQMLDSKTFKKKFTEEEIDAMVKESLVKEAKDKIEFSLSGQIRRGAPAKKGMNVETFEKEWRSAMKKRLIADGFPFSLTKKEQEIVDGVKLRRKKEAAEELSNIASEAMKKILSSI